MKWIKKGKIFQINENQYTVSHSQCPIALHKYSDVYRIYFSSRDINNCSLPVFIDFDIKLKKIIKIGNKPLLQLGSIGTFDEAGVMPQDIIKHEDKIYMYYTGWHLRTTTPFSTAIGLAISNDGGDTFKKVSIGPILSVSKDDPFFVGGNSVIVDENKFKMWYLSCTEWKKIANKFEPVYLIKYAESDDGIEWQRKNHICIPYEYDGEAIARPYVIKDSKTYKMWYSSRSSINYRGEDAKNSYKIGYAESEDGLNWIRKDKNVGIRPSKNDWDSEMIAYASIIFNNKKIMFYNGNGFGKSGFGYAVLED
jgi:hypothetical protein